MDLRDTIQELASGCLPGDEFFIVDVKVTGKTNQQKVLVIADGDNGISIDDCAELSRRLGEALDVQADLFPGTFNLEVSSPGADEPIRMPRQYVKNKGRRLEIINEEDEVITAKLESVNESSIMIIPEGKKKKKPEGKDKQQEPTLVEIPFSKIKKSTVIISFK